MSTDDIRDPGAVTEASDVDLGAVDGPIPGRDGGPQDEEAMAAAEGLTASPDTARTYAEMLERGASQRGEGRLP